MDAYSDSGRSRLAGMVRRATANSRRLSQCGHDLQTFKHQIRRPLPAAIHQRHQCLARAATIQQRQGFRAGLIQRHDNCPGLRQRDAVSHRLGRGGARREGVTLPLHQIAPDQYPAAGRAPSTRLPGIMYPPSCWPSRADDIDRQCRPRIDDAQPALFSPAGAEHRQPAIDAHATRIRIAVAQAPGARLGARKPRLQCPTAPQQRGQFLFRRRCCDTGISRCGPVVSVQSSNAAGRLHRRAGSCRATIT